MLIKCLIIFKVTLTLTTNVCGLELNERMEADGIVPGTLEEAPSAKITINYPSGKTVKFGQELTPTEVKDEPQVSWEADSDKFYTLIMFDPDAPSRDDPKFADVKHWLVGNVLGCNVATGDVIAEYFGSGPPKGTGLHRYIFLVFEQTDKIEFDEPRSLKLSRANRLNWSLRAFRKKYALGKAFAGNYFKAQWDPYVDERNKHVTNN